MLKGMKPPSRELLCKVSAQATSLNKEDFAALEEALKDPKWSHEMLAIELTKRGFEISREALRKHRRGICNCAK